MSTTRRLTIATLIGAAILGLTVGAAPAQAVNDFNCDAGEGCWYENNDFNAGASNHVHQWEVDDLNYSNDVWFNSSDGMNDETSSIWNRDAFDSLRLYQNSNHGGANSQFGPGASDGFLANNSIGDNRASSHFWVF